MTEADDYLTMEGATRLASRIRDYWSARAEAVRVWVEPIKRAGLDDRAYQVRSDLVGGLPARGAR